MKHAFLWLACATVASGQWSSVGTPQVASCSSYSCTATSAAMDTTGANLLVVGVSNYTNDATTVTLTDSKSNVWHHLANHATGNFTNIAVWYSFPTSVGSGHAFSVTGYGPAFVAQAFALSGNTPGLDNRAGEVAHAINGGSQSTIQPGAFLPSANSELVLSLSGYAAVIGQWNVNSPFTLSGEVLYGSSAGVGLGYQIQTTATSENPTWSAVPQWFVDAAVTIVAFGIAGTPTCDSASLSPASASVGYSAGTGSLAVTVSPPGCLWTPSSDSGWLTISGAQHTGSGSLPYSYSTNLSTQGRAGIVTVAGSTFGLTQSGGPVPPHTQHFPNLSNTTYINDAMTQVPANLQAGVNTWMGQRFDWILGGTNMHQCYANTGDAHGGNLTQVNWAAYGYMPLEKSTWTYDIQTAAVNGGFALEDMFLHSSVDMNYGGNSYTSQTAQFDFMEPYYCTGYNYVGAVFTYNAGAYTDVGSATWSGGSTAIPNMLYVGSIEPFDQMNVVISTPRSGGSVAYNYWNGSAWTALSMSSPNSDGTSGLTASGKLYFYPPSDWTARTLPVNETSPVTLPVTTSKFWIQVVVTGASTAPIYTTIKGDDWSVSSAGNNFRGWSTTDGNRINVGTRLEYNPTPPANASAHFRYQSRVTWYGQNVFLGNPSSAYGGVREWARYLAYSIDIQMASSNYDSAFFDSAGGGPVQPITPADAEQYFDFNHTAGWYNEWDSLYADTISILKAEHGSNFKVSINGNLPVTQGSATLGDLNLQEEQYYGNLSIDANHPFAAYGVSQGNYFDWALPTYNTNGTKFLYQCTDAWSIFKDHWIYSSWHYADRGNRTPLICLTMYYLGSNQNTAFAYAGADFSDTGYYDTDQVYTYVSPATTITAAIAPNYSTCNWSTWACDSRTITLASAAGCGSMIRLGLTTSGEEVNAEPVGVKVYGYGPTDATAQVLAGTQGVNLQSGTSTWAGSLTTFSSLTWGGITYHSGLSIAWTYWNGTAWATLAITSDTTNGLTQDGKVSWTAPADWARTTVPGTSESLYYVQLVLTFTGPYFNFMSLRSEDWTTFAVTWPIYNSYSSGSPASCIQQQHLSVIGDPSASSVYGWTHWFPAMGVDIGTPNPAGMNGGARMVETPWKTGGSPDYISGLSHATCDASGCSDLWRRDFTKGIVLFRPWKSGSQIETELDTPSQPIALGGTYYPLSADGTLGAPVTSVSLRAGEAAILMGVSGVVNYRPVFGPGVVSCKGCVR